MSKGTSKTRIENILKSKCPKCHTGRLFKDKNPYNLKMMFEMNDCCSNCGQSFAPEPRFYEGAMYVSYAFSVAIVVANFVAFNVLTDDVPLIPLIVSTILLAFGLSPVSFRLSRTIWIHLFYSFDPNKVNSKYHNEVFSKES